MPLGERSASYVTDTSSEEAGTSGGSCHPSVTIRTVPSVDFAAIGKASISNTISNNTISNEG